MCPRSSNPFYIVSYYIKWVTTSWTHGTQCYPPGTLGTGTSGARTCGWRSGTGCSSGVFTTTPASVPSPAIRSYAMSSGGLSFRLYICCCFVRSVATRSSSGGLSFHIYISVYIRCFVRSVATVFTSSPS